MRRLIRLRFVAVALGAATGLVLVASVYSVASNPQTEESKGDPAQNPCFGLTDSECAALIADSEKEFEAKYATWLADFNSRDIDLRTLPTAPLNADYPAPLTDLDAAVGAADVIVVATAKSVRFEPQWAHLTLVVEQTIKGSTGGRDHRKAGGWARPVSRLGQRRPGHRRGGPPALSWGSRRPLPETP